ncbi:unnamed protein product [Pseudo-nitzschia multistriata]|uniref:Myosin motor domain-containing protein n=1 Tax=Pseudo-nitzschia multistriata TaxID=183589 RepID=A0A448Z176_9STRA|nr:unnamed protein product [Pseudo-nitzschia multistriata]
MDHLACAQLSRPALNDDAQSRTTTSSDSKDIIHRIIQSSPVFEAFGNAKTIRNDNSSRFGKFIQLQFAIEPRAVARREGRDVPYTELFGSRVSTYLLEKNRVVFHSEGERTFHIFYQLLAAPSDFKQAMWPFFGDLDANDFLYTAESADETNSEDEHELWSKTKKALETFKVKNVSLTVLMRALGIVLQLGNLVFEHDSSSEYEQSTIISSKDQLERLSEMMGVESHDLQETITSRTLRTPNEEPIKVQLTPEVAKEACDGLAKEIYARIFEAVVQRVNKYTMPNEQNVDNESGTLKQISLLDIFGFENFEVNKFEQLCINYCNEKLQGRYVEDNFHEIKDQYIEEGVDLYDFKLVDNSDILHLLEGTHGLITILNEECFRPKGNDESFVFKAKKRHVGSTGKLIDKNLHTRTEFDINHFAGSVCYDAQNFVLSNTDKLPPDLIACAANSTNVIIRDEFRKLLVSEEDGTGPKRRKNTRKTVLSKFQVQLNSLMSAMEGTKIRYIRCIKPNKSMIPKMTDHASAMRQMECSGLLTALTISRESYPQSMEYEFILNRYSCLPDNYELSEGKGDMELREKVSHMLTKCLKPISRKNRDGSRIMPFACGKTRVFFKAGAQDQLEDLIGQYYDTNARVIQSWCRGSMAARLKIRKKKAIYTIQSFSRMALAILYFRLHRSAATIICNWVRCCFAVAVLRKRYEDSILEAQRQVQTTYSSKPLSKTDGPHILETNREFVSASGSSSKETLQKLEEQIGELSNINIGLTKEIFKLRHEKNRMRQQHQSTVVQMSSKFSVLKKELESTNRKYQRQKQGSDKVICKGEDKDISREIACLKEKHSLAVIKLKDELHDTRKSHQQYLTRLVDVLETTHNMREEEIAKISRELISIKKEKDDKIMSLRREIKALKKANTSKLSSSNGVGTRKDTDDSKHFNDAAADLENFVIQSTTQEHQNNADAVKQQQKMLDMIRSLKILYQNKS